MSLDFQKSEKIAPLVVMTMSLAQASFGQSAREEAIWTRSGMLTLESPCHAISTPNEIPIVFSQEHNAKSILFANINHGSNFDFTIRGPFARELYKNKVLLIQLNADLDNHVSWVYKGNGFIFIKKDSDTVETRSFQISRFGMDKYGMHNDGVPQEWKWNFSSWDDSSLNTDAAALSALDQVKARVAQVMDLNVGLDDASLDPQSGDSFYLEHLIKLSAIKGEYSDEGTLILLHRGSNIASQVFNENTEIEENLKKLGLKFTEKLSESESILKERIPKSLLSTRDELKDAIAQAQELNDDFARLTLIAFIDVRNVGATPLTAAEVTQMDPVSFITNKIEEHLKTFDQSITTLRDGASLIKEREEQLKTAEELVNSARNTPFINDQLFDLLSLALTGIKDNLENSSIAYNRSWEKFAQFKKKYEEKKAVYDLEQGRLQAEEDRLARIQAEEQKSSKRTRDWLILIGFVGVVSFIEYIRAVQKKWDAAGEASIKKLASRSNAYWEEEKYSSEDYRRGDPPGGPTGE
jgi:hypothetical protein